MSREVDLPEYAADLWQPFRHLAWHGGRGPGKTRTVATGLILQSMERHERVLCGREFQRSIRDSSKRVLEDEIDRLGVRSAFDSTETEIRGPHESLFLFSGVRGNASALKSIEGVTTFWGDEAQAFSQASIDTVVPTIRAPGSRLIWTWNPDLATDPIDVMFRGENGPPPNSIVREVNYPDNPWFPDELRVEMEYTRSRDIDKYNHVWLGQYRQNSEARVFKNWRVEAFDSPTNVDYRIGADFGFSIDPSCAIRCWIDGRNLYIDYEAYGHGIEITNLPSLFMSIPDAEKWWMTADSSRPETISYLRKNGFPRIAPALKGARSVEEGVEWLKGFDIIVHPRCTHMIDELTLYSYKLDPLTGQVLPVLADKDNHCIAEDELVWTERGDVPVQFVKAGDRVMTRLGWRPVLWSGPTDINREIIEVVTTVGTVRCTPDHEIYTANGFVRADALRYGDEIIGDANWLNGEKLSGCLDRVDISTRSDTTTTMGVGSIVRFGKRLTALSPRDIISTTLTKTRSIMNCPTWNWLRQRNTEPDISSGLLRGLLTRPPILIASDIYQKHGTPPQKASSSIGGLVELAGNGGNLPKRIANNAARNSRSEKWTRRIGSVQMPANLRIAGRAALMMLKGFAATVINHLSRTDTASSRIVRGHVVTVRAAGRSRQVYDLTVCGQHEFFAGGVLVHNCIDSLRYGCEGARRAMQNKTRTVAVKIPSTQYRKR